MRLRPDTQDYQNYIDQASHILAKSLFLLFLLLIIDLIICIGLLTGGDLSQLSTSQIGLITVLCIPVAGLFWMLLRTHPNKWVEGSRRVVWVFTNPVFNLIVTAFVVEICIFIITFDKHFNVDNSALVPVIILLGFWLAIVWLMVSYPLLISIVNHPIWMLTSLTIGMLIVITGTVQGNYAIMRDLYRLQRINSLSKLYLGDELQTNNVAYWTEYQSIYRPNVAYIGHRSTPFEGKFINVSPEGIRRTIIRSQQENLSEVMTIQFYGGSTAWGYGARDDYTIPSHIGQILQNEYQLSSQITNYGEIGYNSFNDKVMFDVQLLQGNIPDIAIFYQGYNDIVLGAIKAGYIGASPDTVPLASIPLESVESILEYYGRYTKTLQATAKANGFTAVFVWQPTWVNKTLSSYEEFHVMRSNLVTRAELVNNFYQELNPRLETLMADSTIEHFLFLSDLFAEQTETIFIDVVHITEDGNQQVADVIVDYLFENNLVDIKE